MRFRSVFLMALLVFSHEAWANRINYKPLTMAVNKGDRLTIKGFKGSVRLIANDKSDVLVVKLGQENPDKASKAARRLFDEWSISMQKEGDTVALRVQSPQSKKDWAQLLMTGELPSFFIEIQSPSLPTNIAWGDGVVTVANWKNSVHLSHKSGTVSFRNGKGDLKVYIEDGRLEIKEQEGQVRVESYKAKVDIQSLKGLLELENFAGDSKVSYIDGPSSLVTFSGTSRLDHLKGRLEFDNGRSSLHLDKFQGELRGKSGQGGVVATLTGEADARIRTKEGNVYLHAPGSGAKLNLGTVDGQFIVPNYLRRSQLPNVQLRQGELRGTKKGYIFVRTESGLIKVR